MYIIITRHARAGLTAITCGMDMNEPNPPIMEFEDEEVPIDFAETHPLCEAFGYQVVNIDL